MCSELGEDFMNDVVKIVGAGPGDVELITLKGLRLLESADLVVYAGSLVNPELLQYMKEGAVALNSAIMTLEEIVDVMVEAIGEGRTVVRLHTGDPSIYGAIAEQIRLLREKGVGVEIIPGVTSAFAAASALELELTQPMVSQSVIFTRVEGRTPVPELEKLSALAAHKSTLCIYLSISLLDKLLSELCAAGYSLADSVAVVYRASWADQKILKTSLGELKVELEKNGIVKQAMIIVGRVLDGEFENSLLYDKGFSHEYRVAGRK
jgi:precorrin-4/cobalt-precorrin-4 C11-methyltransferase